MIDQRTGVVAVEFVLGRTWKYQIDGNSPGALGLGEGHAILLCIFVNAATADLFEFLEPLKLFTLDAVWIVDETARV